ncbi:hypothetical protein VTK73DRAFT_470 [Phialemonium thermophilum]|uniref:Uncharacterized protein n=1 Tax=Phialemonium thermophilum TaxID=223376 RepID=A0ABR3VUY5_9PEZI
MTISLSAPIECPVWLPVWVHGDRYFPHHPPGELGLAEWALPAFPLSGLDDHLQSQKGGHDVRTGKSSPSEFCLDVSLLLREEQMHQGICFSLLLGDEQRTTFRWHRAPAVGQSNARIEGGRNHGRWDWKTHPRLEQSYRKPCILKRNNKAPKLDTVTHIVPIW